MTLDIALVLGILAISLILFVSEVIRMDLVALLVLGALAVTGLVSGTEAFSGFSNSAVITVWAMFILSEGLTRTGIANIIGNQVLRVAGRREVLFSPAYGQQDAAELADWILQDQLPVRFQVQLHKILWGDGPGH